MDEGDAVIRFVTTSQGWWYGRGRAARGNEWQYFVRHKTSHFVWQQSTTISLQKITTTTDAYNLSLLLSHYNLNEGDLSLSLSLSLVLFSFFSHRHTQTLSFFFFANHYIHQPPNKLIQSRKSWVRLCVAGSHGYGVANPAPSLDVIHRKGRDQKNHISKHWISE